MIRVSLGIASLVVSILFAAQALGLIPDRDGAILSGRRNLCESVAIAGSLALMNHDDQAIAETLRAVAERNHDIVSAGVRSPDGQLKVSVGAHEVRWNGYNAATSTATHMHLPIALENRPWGRLEICFRPLTGTLAADWMGGSIVPLAGFVAACGSLATYLFLRSVLRKADLGKARVVPQRVRDTLNTVMEGVLVLDRDQKIALANDAFGRMLGRDPAALRGVNASDLAWAWPRTRGPALFPWSRSIEDGTPQRGTVLDLQTTGEGRRIVSVNSTSILGDDGTCRGALATFDDLTPVEAMNGRLKDLLRRLKKSHRKIRRQKSALARAKQAAEVANRAKGRFLANVSHEIRTPMCAVIGMTEIVLESTLSGAQRESLEVVKESADSLLTVINDILDLSKIEAGKFDLDPVSFDLRESLGDDLRPLAHRAAAKGLELVLDVAAEAPEVVHGDAGRLRQVLVNLVGNAIKFTAVGEVVVRVAVEALAGDAVVLHLSVADTGIGIAPEKTQLIFEPFEQADGSTTRRFGGTGLGLTISRRLVEMMEGRVWVESVLGQGSVFHFTARLGLPAQPAPALTPEEATALAGRPVLVVDGNATSRAALVAMLRRLGVQPHTFGDAAAALEDASRAAREGSPPYALALIDAHLGGDHGFELVERLDRAALPAGRSILLLSAADRNDTFARCQALGVAGHLTRPVKESALRKAVCALAIPGWSRRASSSLDNESEREASRAGPAQGSLRILLVDDHEFNRRLGSRKLTGWGHQVVVASSGSEALALLEQQDFDLALTDIQMAGLDGFELTAAVRRAEAEAGTGRHLPIIAMTARAMKEDREACLAGGMDGHVTKPIRDRDLWQAIQNVIPSVSRARAEGAAETDTDTETEAVAVAVAEAASRSVEALDWSAVLKRIGGDERLLRELVAVFRLDAPRLVTELAAALDEGDAPRLDRAAHSLKGMLGFFQLETATAAAAALELTARRGDLGPAPAGFRVLCAEIDRVSPLLDSFAEGHPL
jgi:signal transduction histidine kinase/DNA-binding response OmpR family regulator/HPt (histidine-containing phosphotransfer) domain-containing protein